MLLRACQEKLYYISLLQITAGQNSSTHATFLKKGKLFGCHE